MNHYITCVELVMWGLRVYHALGIRASIINMFPEVFYIQNRERTKYANLTTRLVTHVKRRHNF